jgi:hypothetical protein
LIFLEQLDEILTYAAIDRMIDRNQRTLSVFVTAVDGVNTTALDMGAAGFDFDSGHGLIQANQALAALTQDADGDGVGDTVDNCTLVANGPDDGITAGSPQNGTDGDGYGNICDGDLNQDDYVNVVDLGLFKQRFFTADPDADLNGDGIVNVLDLGLFKAMFFKVPGPSGMAP